MMHVGKIPKKVGKKLAKFSKILAKFAKIWKTIETIQQFLTKILRLESGVSLFLGFDSKAVFLFSPFFGVVLARSFFPQFSIMDSKAVQRSALC